jgi:hypothetical protein
LFLFFGILSTRVKSNGLRSPIFTEGFDLEARKHGLFGDDRHHSESSAELPLEGSTNNRLPLISTSGTIRDAIEITGERKDGDPVPNYSVVQADLKP